MSESTLSPPDSMRPPGPVLAFVVALVLAVPVAFVVYLEIASSVDRSYRSAQLVNPSVAAVLGYAALGLVGPVVGLAVALAVSHRRDPRPFAATTVALTAEVALLIVGVGAAVWLLYSGVT